MTEEQIHDTATVSLGNSVGLDAGINFKIKGEIQMPIKKIEESIELQFGSGDIEVMPGLLKTDNSIGALCFFQKQEATPIGTHTDYTPYKVAEIEETPVRMVFNKIESIDVVIRSLQETKEFMLNGLPKAEAEPDLTREG